MLRDGYLLRMLSSTAASLLIVIAAFKLWPADNYQVEYSVNNPVHPRELFVLNEIRPTRQSNIDLPPPPVSPLPLYTPRDVVLEPDELDLQFIDTSLADSAIDPSSPPFRDPSLKGSKSSGEATMVSPRPVRFVEPEYTRPARMERVRAEIVVEVRVDHTGSVNDSRVIQRFLLSANGYSKEPVAQIGYGLEESALTAAEQWRFLPAYLDGVPVEGSTILTFRFGI